MRLIARCVLPVPIGPARRTFSPRAIQSQRASSANLAQPRRQRVERHRRGRLGGPEREEQRLASLERAPHPLGGEALTQLDDGTEHVSEDDEVAKTLVFRVAMTPELSRSHLASEIVQGIMRTAVREDPTAHVEVFLPIGEDTALAVSILRELPGALYG